MLDLNHIISKCWDADVEICIAQWGNFVRFSLSNNMCYAVVAEQAVSDWKE